MYKSTKITGIEVGDLDRAIRYLRDILTDGAEVSVKVRDSDEVLVFLIRGYCDSGSNLDDSDLFIGDVDITGVLKELHVNYPISIYADDHGGM